MTVAFHRAIPVLRIFSLEKAREFYVDFPGCKVDWEHRFEPAAAAFVRVSRDGLRFNLSEHHGDGTPGSVAVVCVTGVRELPRELNDKKDRATVPPCRSGNGMTERTASPSLSRSRRRPHDTAPLNA
jgi:catechol 2,3-dioxygenase-like lactoylglutathione lyase family enzyme